MWQVNRIETNAVCLNFFFFLSNTVESTIFLSFEILFHNQIKQSTYEN